jgi:hypothetical protein
MNALFSCKRKEKLPAFSLLVCTNINQTQGSYKVTAQFF